MLSFGWQLYRNLESPRWKFPGFVIAEVSLKQCFSEHSPLFGEYVTADKSYSGMPTPETLAEPGLEEPFPL
jgi:hypothetical protein